MFTHDSEVSTEEYAGDLFMTTQGYENTEEEFEESDDYNIFNDDSESQELWDDEYYGGWFMTTTRSFEEAEEEFEEEVYDRVFDKFLSSGKLLLELFHP